MTGSPTTFLSTSRGLCRDCGQVVEARYLADPGGVWLERICPEHGRSRALVAETLAWYLDAMAAPVAARPPAKTLQRRTGPCPGACGPCEMHAQACNLPVISITNACDLRCPICFTYNRKDQRYFMSREAFAEQIDFLIDAAGPLDLINVTGGEPTLHPQLLELLAEARRPEIGRITVNSNGLRIAREPELAERLAELGAYVILSLDTLQPAVSRRVHGVDLTAQKQQALENLARAGVSTTLLMVLIGGVNEQELAPILRLALERPHVRSLTVQTMAYTGQGGGGFLPRRHIPVEGVERRIEVATEGRIAVRHFQPLPTAHPLCYGVTYLLLDDEGRAHPLSALFDRQILASQLADGYLLQPTTALEGALREGIDRLWSEDRSPALLQALRELLLLLYPPGEPLTVHERQRRVERRVKTIYVHAHMDEDTWEVGRVMRCPDQVPVDGERLIGACNYNLFYRKRDERFWVEP